MQLLETPRLSVRYLTIRDLESLIPILGDPKVMEFSILGVHNHQQIRKFIEQRLLSYLDPGFGLYALVHKHNQELIGYCGFFRQTIDQQPEIEVGYRLATKYWGQGLGTEAAKYICAYGQKRFNFKRLICLIDAKNRRSIRVAKKLGMKPEKKINFYGINVEVYSINYS